VVGSKNFTEQVLLGEIVAAHLERRLEIEVDRKLNLGGTLLAHEALKGGSIDLYPEYTGTALTAVLKQPALKDAAESFARVQSGYQPWNIEWLAPLGFNNSFAMVVMAEVAREQRLKTLSDAAKRPEPWQLGVGYEFTQRPDGLNGLVQTNG
jgi:glycine betaine/choline ABC-type transport system substrate-binding protein